MQNSGPKRVSGLFKSVWFLIAGLLLLGHTPGLAEPYLRVSKNGVVYYHFNSKDDILILANERFMVPLMKFMVEADNYPQASEGLTAYIKQYLTYWMQHPRELSFIFLTMAKTISDKNLWRLYNGYTKQMAAFFEGMYRKGITAGEFMTFDARSVSVSLMAALDGIIGYLVMDKDLSLENTIAHFIETFINAYKE